MIARTASLLLLGALFFACSSAFAQQPTATKGHATIRCDGQTYVPVTVDEEQGLPFQLVDKAACGSRVTILSDPQGYTVKVRTAAGKTGYVARYQIVIEDAAKPSTSAPAGEANDSAKAAPSQPSTESTRQENGPSKPRVYVSDTESWNESGGFGNPSSVAPGALYGGYNPDLVDVYQDFTSGCSAITVTQKKADADFVVLFDKGTPKKGFAGLHGLVKVNKVTVLSKTGGTLLSETARSEDAAVTMACSAVSQPPANASGAARQSSQ